MLDSSITIDKALVFSFIESNGQKCTLVLELYKMRFSICDDCNMTLRNYLILLVITLHTSPINKIFTCFARQSFALLTFDQLIRFKVNKNLPSRIKGPEQRIQYIIHQTYEMDELPSDMVMAIETTQEKNPEYAYRFYNHTERREVIVKNLGHTVLAAYDKIIPNAYKADLFRYCVVYTYGGCYTDIGFMFIRPLRDVLRSSDTFFSTSDGVDVNNSGINSAFFCAEAGHQILFLTIKSVVQRVAASNYGVSILDITGPAAFQRGFRAYFHNQSMLIYPQYREFSKDIRLLRPEYDYGCTYYPVLDMVGDGQPILFHKYPRYGPDVTALLPGSRHYTDDYFGRTSFNESITVPVDGKYLINHSDH